MSKKRKSKTKRRTAPKTANARLRKHARNILFLAKVLRESADVLSLIGTGIELELD